MHWYDQVTRIIPNKLEKQILFAPMGKLPIGWQKTWQYDYMSTIGFNCHAFAWTKQSLHIYRIQQLQALAFQRAFSGIACLVLLPSPCNDSSLYLSFSNVCKATSVTHTKWIYRNLLRKETSFVCYTSSVLRKSRHMKQKEKITHCC